jgi:hypothetical protein
VKEITLLFPDVLALARFVVDYRYMIFNAEFNAPDKTLKFSLPNRYEVETGNPPAICMIKK